MTEKASPDSAYRLHDEKNANQAELANPAGRRQSVALNIVENPLKVSLVISIYLFLFLFTTFRYYIDRIP